MSLGNLTFRPPPSKRPIDPRVIFNGLTLRGNVENLWTPQGEALDGWHKARDKQATTIEMPTGGGKTLVGLLVAQSLSNEGRGKVLYVCPTNQLVEQTAAKAREVGLGVATYMKRKWTNQDAYTTNQGPCITSYAAAFTARSIFRKDDIDAIILDDAHVAAQELRSRFTLTIDDKHPAFQPLRKHLAPLAAQMRKTSRFDEACAGDPNAMVFFPAFTATRNGPALTNVLKRAG
ncbi:MAG: DEAD/DEAH box helicase family protein, partial [Rhodoglobus sp.]